MSKTVIVLVEDALTRSDAAHIARLHPGAAVEILVAADTERHVVADLIDHLGLLDLRAAWDDVVGRHASPSQARAEAAEALARSVAELRGAGLDASGYVVDEDPLPALAKAIGTGRDVEVIVVTTPQMLEDTFHRTWAHRARERFGVPVLHFYTGTQRVGS